MYLDLQTLFSDNQTLAFAAGSANSTNVIDLGTVGTIPLGGSPIYDIGRGEPVEVIVQITADVTSAGSATVQFKLVSSAAADLSTPTVHYDSGAIAKATLVAGYYVPIRVIPQGVALRYLGLIYTVATATTTAGTVTAGILLDRSSNP